MEGSRNFGSIIKEAELSFRSPDFVFEFLLKRASLPHSDPESFFVDERVEGSLLDRKNGLIDLGLAKYARHPETLRALFFGADSSTAIKLAVLQNQGINYGVLGGAISRVCQLFGELESAVNWINSASDQQLEALFTNKNVGDRFLSNLFRQDKPLNSIENSVLLKIVRALSTNARMKQSLNVDGDDDDWGYVERINPWLLCTSVPTTGHWANALGCLLPNLEITYLPSPSLEVANRWRIEDCDSENIEREIKYNNRGFLSDFQSVRMQLARHALETNEIEATGLVQHHDIALRCASYAFGKMTEQQIIEAIERDPKFLGNYALRNLNLWKNKKTRNALERAVKIFDDNDGVVSRVFWDLYYKHSNENPEWFDGE